MSHAMSRCTKDNDNSNSNSNSNNDSESDSNINLESRARGRIIRGSATARINKCTEDDWRYCMTIDSSSDYITS